MELMTTNKNTVHIKLTTKENLLEAEENNSNLQTFSYITMKHGISNESYHELSMQFPEMPRSYKVNILYMHSYNVVRWYVASYWAFNYISL